MKTELHRYIGLMSGTSLDGLDIVLVDFDFNRTPAFSIKASKAYEFPTSLQEGLKNCRSLSAVDLVKLEHEFSQFSVEKINFFLDQLNIDTSSIKAIGHHGHTVFHQPEIGITTQILNGSLLAAKTGITTVCDFRSLDVALGGQGAPLVPIGDRDLFTEYDACMNLGGIANISLKLSNQVKAFDICPFNIVLNHYAQKVGKPYDTDGQLSSLGQTIETLLKELNNLPYYHKKHPKSLGIEWIENEFLSIMPDYQDSYNTNDLLATTIAHYIEQISSILKENEVRKLLITGGGTFNSYFIKKLKEKNPETEIIIPNKEIIDYKEAIIFAYLAYLRLHNKINVLSEVTGANTDSCSGAIYHSPLKRRD